MFHNTPNTHRLLSSPQMNKFFKPALSLLLELKLGECGIERRLHPLITFLTRHRSALQKYIYPECFHTLMNYLWNCILQVHSTHTHDMYVCMQWRLWVRIPLKWLICPWKEHLELVVLVFFVTTCISMIWLIMYVHVCIYARCMFLLIIIICIIAY